MKHLFASCAVIALMAAPALAQSTYDPAASVPDAEMMPEETAPEDTTQADEFAPAYEPDTGIEAQVVADPAEEADETAVMEPEAETAAATEAEESAEMQAAADAGSIEAPINVAELPQEYSTADLNALMLSQLNEEAIEIAEMQFETQEPVFSTASNEAAADVAVTEDYASTQTETFAATGTNPTPDALATDEYAATETLPETDATVAPESYAAVEPSAQDNVAPPYDGATELSEETGSTMVMAEQVDPSAETAMMAEGDIDQTAVEIAANDSRFSTLVELVGIAGLEEALAAEGPYTVFAPTNDAFAALPESTLAHLKTEEGKAELTAILKSHVAEGTVLAGEVPLAGQEVQTLGDTALNVTGSVDGTLNVDGSATIGEGMYASNGVVYAIDTVILPEPEVPTVADDTEG